VSEYTSYEYHMNYNLISLKNKTNKNLSSLFEAGMTIWIALHSWAAHTFKQLFHVSSLGHLQRTSSCDVCHRYIGSIREKQADDLDMIIGNGQM